MSVRRRTFAADFSRLVGPTLAKRCDSEGLFVTLGLVRFAEAQRRIMRHAMNRGAGLLSDDELIDLMDQVGTSLIEAIDRYEPMVAAVSERGRRL